SSANVFRRRWRETAYSRCTSHPFSRVVMTFLCDKVGNDGMLIKRPLLIQDGKILQIGYRTKYENLGL
ncbi:ArsC/Spx/MgsR family protein, partial [Streptococcus suis]|nr:ArsC/Spx/MgsR family protein [Streptococcus suis]